MKDKITKRKDGLVDNRARKKGWISPKKATVTREKMIFITENLGVRKAFIAKATGIHPTTVSRFISGEQRMFNDNENFKKLDELLKKYDYTGMK